MYNLQLTPFEIHLLIVAICAAKTLRESDIGSYSSADLFSEEEQQRLDMIKQRLFDLIVKRNG